MSKRVSFEEIGGVMATFLAGEGVKKGQMVTIAAGSTVGACVEGGAFCGVALDVAEDGAASVQVRGFAQVPVSGEGVAPGWTALTADGLGGLKAAGAAAGQGQESRAAEEESRELLVVCVDEDAGTAVVLL